MSAVLTRLEAISYTIETSGPLGSYHWEEYEFRYTPGVGWTQTLVTGNTSDLPGALAVIADDGSSGQDIGLLINYGVLVNSMYVTSGQGIMIGNETAALTNFGGMTSGTVATSILVHSSDYSSPERTFAQAYTRPFLENGEIDESMSIPYKTGLVPAPYNAPRQFDFDIDHLQFAASGLQVIDDNLPAVFGIRAEMWVIYNGAKVVSDSGSSLSFLGIGILALGAARRIRNFKR